MRGRLTVGEWLYRILRPGPAVVRRPVGPFTIQVDLDELQGRFVYFNGYEPEVVRFIRCIVRRGETVLDIGAHDGYLTAVLADVVGHRGAVHAFEPNPAKFDRLLDLRNHHPDAPVFPWREAVSGHAVDLTRCVDLRIHPIFPMYTTIRPELADPTTPPLKVPATSLDAFLERESIAEVGFIKIDVEGAEGAVISGFRRALERGMRPTILCEVKPVLWNEDDRQAFRILLDSGYSAGHLHPQTRVVHPVSQRWIQERRETLNLVFSPQ